MFEQSNKLMLQEKLLEKPTTVRLKFLGPVQGSRAPKQGSMRDVRVGTLEDLAEIVEDWLGAPSGWQLTTATHHPVTAETLRRPTSSQCPVVVNIRNAQDYGIEDIMKRMADLEKKLDSEVENRLHVSSHFEKRMENIEIGCQELTSISELKAKLQPNATFRRSGNCLQRWCAGLCHDLLPFMQPLLATVIMVSILYMILLIQDQVMHENTAMRKRVDDTDTKLKHFGELLNDVNNRNQQSRNNDMETVDLMKRLLERRVEDIEDAIKEIAAWEDVQDDKITALVEDDRRFKSNNKSVWKQIEWVANFTRNESTNLSAVNRTAVGASAAAVEVSRTLNAGYSKLREDIRSVNSTALGVRRAAQDAQTQGERQHAALERVQTAQAAVREQLAEANSTAVAALDDARRQSGRWAELEKSAQAINRTAIEARQMAVEQQAWASALEKKQRQMNRTASFTHKAQAEEINQLQKEERDARASSREEIVQQEHELRRINQTALKANDTAAKSWSASRRHMQHIGVLDQRASQIEAVVSQANASIFHEHADLLRINRTAAVAMEQAAAARHSTEQAAQAANAVREKQDSEIQNLSSRLDGMDAASAGISAALKASNQIEARDANQLQQSIRDVRDTASAAKQQAHKDSKQIVLVNGTANTALAIAGGNKDTVKEMSREIRDTRKVADEGAVIAKQAEADYQDEEDDIGEANQTAFGAAATAEDARLQLMKLKQDLHATDGTARAAEALATSEKSALRRQRSQLRGQEAELREQKEDIIAVNRSTQAAEAAVAAKADAATDAAKSAKSEAAHAVAVAEAANASAVKASKAAEVASAAVKR